jgi:gamma-glutamyltranspeptidase/glutathione hydrolase
MFRTPLSVGRCSRRTILSGPRALFILLPALFVFLACEGVREADGAQNPGAVSVSEPAQGTQGMVSSAHPLATEAGLEILRAGGNAFDAAVAVAAALNVVEPMMSGMGGYGTILVYSREEGRARFLNSSGRIPLGVDSDAYRAPTPGYMENRRGAKAVSTPGNVNAWAAMSRGYGALPWAQLLEPAARIASEGFELDDRGARLIKSAWEDFPDHARAFYGQGGRPLQAGERLIQMDLAHSLRTVASEGPEAFHGGSLGQAVDRAMQDAGGFLRLRDLAENESEWWEPVEIEYRGYRVMVPPPPANSWPALVRLGMMSRFDVQALGHNSADYLHRFAETTKHAFWTRLRWAGDPEISPPPLDRLLSEEYWAEQVAEIDTELARPFLPPGIVGEMGANTTHFVVADSEGNVVSATQTLGNSFGSRIMPEGTGIWLNNSLAYCTFEPAGNPMDAHPGRRKLSGDAPLFVLRDGKPWVALGTPGGHTIPQTVPQMVMNILDFGMNIQEAIAAPRVSFVEPNYLVVEDGISDHVADALEALGHELRRGGGLGNGHGLTIEWGPNGPVRFTGGADPRGVGLAKGW